MLGQEAAHCGDADHEPLVVLPSRCRQRMTIVILVHDGVSVFIIYLLVDEERKVFVGLRNDAREAHVGQLVIVDVGVGIVGKDVVVLGVWRPISGYVGLRVFVALTNEAHRHGRDVPVMVNVSEALPDGVLVGANLGDAHHLGDNALTSAVVGELLDGVVVNVVIGRDDEVFAAHRSAL